jgi:uncharacterized protein YuzE
MSQGRRVRATVIARWDARRALLRTDAGETVPVEVAPELQERVDVGESVWVEFDDDGEIAAWSVFDLG